jgi:DNA-binding transcriptional LysR family regulator
MNLNRIKLFSIVARYSNITKASQALHVSQSSVSHQMRLLQSEYRSTFYNKNGRGVELTTAGRLFLAQVDPILKQFEDFNEKFKIPQTTKTGSPLLVGGSYGLSSERLPSVIIDFQKKYPQVQVALRAGNHTAIEQLVLKGDVEVALITFPDSLPRLVMEPYSRQRIAAFVSVHHPLAKRANPTVAEILTNSFVVRGELGPESNFNKMLGGLEKKGYALKISSYFDSPEAVKVAVQKGTGVGLLYEGLIRPEVQRGAFKILKLAGLKLYAHSFIVYHKDRPLSESARQFLQLLRQRKRNTSPI